MLENMLPYCMKATRKCESSNRATPILVLQKKLMETLNFFGKKDSLKEIQRSNGREEGTEESDAKSKDKEGFDDKEKAPNNVPEIVIENESDKSPPMSTFSNTPTQSEKEQLKESIDDEQENSDFKTKGEPDWGGLDDLLHDLDVKAGRDLWSGQVVAAPKVKPTGMDYADIEDESDEESQLLPKESAAPPVKAAAKAGNFDYDDIKDTDEAT